jgi:hypothetical protein
MKQNASRFVKCRFGFIKYNGSKGVPHYKPVRSSGRICSRIRSNFSKTMDEF